MQRLQTIGYAKGTVLRDGRYCVESEINRGGSAIVYLAQDLHNNRQVALKVVDYTRDLQMLYKSVKREVSFSAHTQHPNIVQLLDVFADKQRKTLVIVWEFIRGPDLLDCLNRKGGALDEREACFYFCQLLRGLLFMHQTGFAHRDLKPENCVLEDSTQIVRLIDFGLTKHIESARTMLVGTPEYMAPELVRDPNAKFLQYSGGSSSSSSRQGYDAKKVDAWAIGVLFYVLIAATYPFSDSNNPGSGTSMATQRALMAGRYKALPAHNSAGARAVVAQLLVVDPEQRASLEDIAKDPWLLRTAMSYALPRCLDHLVQPPLAPTPSQTAEVAAAAAAASPSSPGQQQHGKMQRTATGGSAVSAVSAASGVTSITTVSDPELVSASAPARTNSNLSTEKTGRRITEESSTSVGNTSSGTGDLQQQQQQQQQLSDLTPQNGRDQGTSKPAAAAAAAGGGSRSGVGAAAPKRVMYAAHTSFSPGTGGKVGLGEQQLYAVRYEAQAAQRAAAAAGASRNATAKQDSESQDKCRCCVIC